MDLNLLDSLKTVVILAAIIAVVVLVHELGHFIAAKICKVKVEEFAFGMGKMLWSKMYKGTLFRINLFPIGGYVKVYGQETVIKGDNESFSEKPAHQRIFILVAGIFMNIVLAVLIFYIYLASLGFITYIPKITDYSFPGIKEEVVTKPWIKEVLPGSSAEIAKLPVNSIIWDVDNLDVKSSSDFSALIRGSFGKTLDIKVQLLRDQSFQDFMVTVNQKNVDGIAQIGVGLSSVEFYKLDYTNQKLFSGFVETYDIFGYSMKMYGELISESIQTKSLEPVSLGTGTIVQVGQVTYRFVSANNFVDILYLLGSISLSLAFFNILPIPALDGGHVMFVIIEKIRGKALSDKFLGRVNIIGFALLMLLFVVLLLKDILQISFIQGIISSVTSIFK